MINESEQNTRLRATSNRATISLLLKPNKDPNLSSYQPISLINVDTKIIDRALALRLEKVIQSIIHPDQTGFVKSRLDSSNTRRLFNIMNNNGCINFLHCTVIIDTVTLDVEKAFNRVNWKVLFYTLEQYSLGFH